MNTHSTDQAPSLRAGAITNREMVNVFTESVAKANVFPAPIAGPDSGIGVDVKTFLLVRAWVKNLAYTKNVWIDIHLFDAADTRIRAESLPLQYSEPADNNGEFFLLKRSIHQAASAGPGWGEPHPDDRKLQFRLYYEVNGQVFTDGAVHQFEMESASTGWGWLRRRATDSLLADLDAQGASCEHYNS